MTDPRIEVAARALYERHEPREPWEDAEDCHDYFRRGAVVALEALDAVDPVREAARRVSETAIGAATSLSTPLGRTINTLREALDGES
jgi:hypothetical protein